MARSFSITPQKQTGDRVVFQPRSAHFQQTIGDDIRPVLETALLQHSALTEKDWVQVHHEGKTWDLRVRELSPAHAVSVIDTDLEAEINPSIETEDRIRAEEEEAQRRLEAVARAALEDAARLRTEAEAEAAAAEQAELERLSRLKVAAEKAAALPPEPSVDGVDGVEPALVASCLFRFPDGGRHARRFLLTDPVQLMFDFVDAQGGSGLPPGGYHLVTSYPRRVFTEAEAGQRMEEAGFRNSREVLFLEPNV